ncbi:hypothetical protein [Mangrovimonas cancribranchiae]|uniref:CarboxypepD_reg-like domain-containing protein n=1 Tax=Mangrovimonas cancribranchiae TaxID=3080055 RepID=A0AAU6P2N4_9FLAO
MEKTKLLVFLSCFFLVLCSYAQDIELKGKLVSNLNVENIHIINQTSHTFSVANKFGEFVIPARKNDTLKITSIQHKPKEVVITESIYSERFVEIFLESLTYDLDAVTVGKILTGDLLKDVESVEGQPVTAKMLGIPSYQGKPLTHNERVLNEATTGGGIIPLNPILNGISGRTKKLKKRVTLERRDELLRKIRERLEDELFQMAALKKDLRADFFYFCAEDPNFITRCKNTNDLEILTFLQEKLQQYKENLKQ